MCYSAFLFNFLRLAFVVGVLQCNNSLDHTNTKQFLLLYTCIIVRPPDVRVYRRLASLLNLFNAGHLNLPDGQATHYIRGLVLACTSKIDLDISPTPPLILTGDKNAKFCLNFRPQVQVFWFQNGARYCKSKKCVESVAFTFFPNLVQQLFTPHTTENQGLQNRPLVEKRTGEIC